jgi:hypothetical protein
MLDADTLMKIASLTLLLHLPGSGEPPLDLQKARRLQNRINVESRGWSEDPRAIETPSDFSYEYGLHKPEDPGNVIPRKPSVDKWLQRLARRTHEVAQHRYVRAVSADAAGIHGKAQALR